jgi:tRNA-2-methylthio-N6-dimethylallyladenosine synthase
MNTYDSELVQSQLENIGYNSIDNIELADIIFLNTCAIRDKAEKTVHNRLTSIEYIKKRKPSVIIGVLGCMAQNLKDELLISKPYVDIILGPDSYRKIPELVKNRNSSLNHIVDTKLSKYEVYDDLFPKRNSGVNAWISIMRGCDKFCTFCIVPFTRGRERSRPVDSIVKEAIDAVKNGFVEITLLGQNVNSYSTPEGGFASLLEKISQVKGVKRIRYTSPHPKDFNSDLLKIMKKYDNICNYIHMPLQAGSNNILNKMNRNYTKEEFLDLVYMIREHIPNCTISTDIIVGFPGETDLEFSETLEMMKKIKFNFSFMFKYSSRPGTKAAEYDNQISEEVKQKRLERLIDLQSKITLNSNKEKIGSIQYVLIEKESKKSSNSWSGRTDGNTWTIIEKNNESIKDIVPVKITHARGVTLFGNCLNKKELSYETN